MIHIQPPNDFSKFLKKPSVFLAGSIEMGVAEKWQEKVASDLMSQDIVILNPRRDDWSSDWEAVIENDVFRAQVEWELDGIAACDVLMMYFSPGTKAPITLMEFGICAATAPDKMIVCCPEGFYRKGNVDVACRRFGIEQAPDLEGLVSRTIEKIRAVQK